MSRENINPEDLRIHIGAKLKQARLDKNLSQKELGELLGVTRVIIGMYERGRLRISIQLLVKICKNLDKPIHFFVDEDLEVENKFQNDLEKKATGYNLKENIEFTLEMSLRNFLKSNNASTDLNERVENIMKYIYKLLGKE